MAAAQMVHRCRLLKNNWRYGEAFESRALPGFFVGYSQRRTRAL